MINQFDWAAKWAQYSPEKIAFRAYETDDTLTFLELQRFGNRLAMQLMQSFGIRKGDRIAILAENGLAYQLLFVAAQKTGCILVPINYRLANAEVAYLLSNAQPKLVISDAKFQHLLNEASFPSQQLSLTTLPQLWEENLPHEFKSISPAITPADPIFILYTSGTTGFPKGALYTHGMLFWNSINTAISLIVNSSSRTVNCMPPFHTGGWNVLTTPFFHHGGYTCLLKAFDPDTILHIIEKEQHTIFMGVPTMLKMMANSPNFATANLDSLEYIIVGGEPMPIPLIEQWHDKGVPIRQGFGMTEAGPNLTSLHQKDAVRKKGSIGHPNFYVQTRIEDANGQLCAPNQPGELLLKGPMITPGYWQNEQATQSAFSNGWFRTGDQVIQDDEGYLFVVDRIKNMYISGGENVYPAEVERVLVQHPAVSEAVVIGIPDPKWGESGQAFVVLNSPLEKDEVIDFCKARLAKFKVPKSIIFLDELPKNDTGKINRKALKVNDANRNQEN